MALLRELVANAVVTARLSSVARSLWGAFILDKGDCGNDDNPTWLLDNSVLYVIFVL